VNAYFKIVLTSLLMLIFGSGFMFAQESQIIAGYHDTTITYYDYKPDIVLQDNATLNFNFDKDSVLDFSLRALYFSALGGNERSLLFIPQNGNKTILGRVDSVNGYKGYRYNNVAAIQYYGDTINSGLSFITDPAYLALNSFYEGYSFDISDWFGNEKKYLAFEMPMGDTLVYGWIRVEVTGYNSITVYDYAFSKKTYLAMDENPKKVLVSIYPNPATNIVNIKMNNNAQTTLRLFDMTGRVLKSKTFYNETSLLLKGIRKGVYTILIETKKGTISRKLIIGD